VAAAIDPIVGMVENINNNVATPRVVTDFGVDAAIAGVTL
jgi:hypothetical protein